MDRQAVPAPQHLGSHWFKVTSTSAQFPTNGRGGATSDVSLSELAGKVRVLVEGWILDVYASPNGFHVVDANGDDILALAPAGGGDLQHAARPGVFEEFGDGIEVQGAFGAKLRNASAPIIVFYSIVK